MVIVGECTNIDTSLHPERKCWLPFGPDWNKSRPPQPTQLSTGRHSLHFGKLEQVLSVPYCAQCLHTKCWLCPGPFGEFWSRPPPPYLHGTKSLTSHIPPYKMAPETNPNQMLNNGKIFSCHFQICTQPYSQIGLEGPLPNVFPQRLRISETRQTNSSPPSITAYWHLLIGLFIFYFFSETYS